MNIEKQFKNVVKDKKYHQLSSKEKLIVFKYMVYIHSMFNIYIPAIEEIIPNNATYGYTNIGTKQDIVNVLLKILLRLKWIGELFDVDYNILDDKTNDDNITKHLNMKNYPTYLKIGNWIFRHIYISPLLNNNHVVGGKIPENLYAATGYYHTPSAEDLRTYEGLIADCAVEPTDQDLLRLIK